MAHYEAHQRYLQKLLEEVGLDDSDNEPVVYEDESDDMEEDNEEVLDHQSESDQEISDVEEETVQHHTSASVYIGKNGTTHWKKHPPRPKTVRTRQDNIIVRLPGPTQATKNLKSAVEIWNYFFDMIIDIIVESTNKYISSIQHNFSRERDAIQTNNIEIRAFIGLLYLSGISHSNRSSAEDLWRKDGYGIEMFYLTMSLQRFRFLLRCIRFDDKETRLDRTKFDKLAPVRTIFDQFVKQCLNGYNHSAFVTIDEMLPAFRGKCSFRQYIPSKPNKYGLKIFAVCDSKVFYTSKLEIYVGTQPDGPYKFSNKPYDVVLRMCKHLSGSHINLTMDNWFTSIPLVEKLLRDYKITTIGTVRKNKSELPLEFTKPAKRPTHTSMFAFTEDLTIVSYIPKQNKNVILTSSMHHHDDIDPDTAEKSKPIIVSTYNKTKGGVDVVDKLCASYDCSRNSRRWPMVIFYHMLNIAGINSLVIYKANNPDKINLRRKQFLREMANELIHPQLQKRVTLTNLPRTLKLRLTEITKTDHRELQEKPLPSGRCTPCGWKKNRKTRFSCYKCNMYMCLDHITGVCQSCREAQ